MFLRCAVKIWSFRPWVESLLHDRHLKHDGTRKQSITEIAPQKDIWATLSFYLLFRMLKENAERETQYQQIINHLSTNVAEGIADINGKLDDMAHRLDNPSA